jgi:hypothetical protein
VTPVRAVWAVRNGSVAARIRPASPQASRA